MPRKKKETTEEEIKKPRRKKKTEEEEKKSPKAGVENLITLDKRSEEERKAICTAGGKKSGMVRRQKKELRQLTKDFLMQDAVGPIKQNMQRLGFDSEDMTNLAAILGVMFAKVLNNQDLNAAKLIMEWAGMAPGQEIRESEAMQKLQMIVSPEASDDTEIEDVVFYIPDNGRDKKDEEDKVLLV